MDFGSSDLEIFYDHFLKKKIQQILQKRRHLGYYFQQPARPYYFSYREATLVGLRCCLVIKKEWPSIMPCFVIRCCQFVAIVKYSKCYSERFRSLDHLYHSMDFNPLGISCQHYFESSFVKRIPFAAFAYFLASLTSWYSPPSSNKVKESSHLSMTRLHKLNILFLSKFCYCLTEK